MISEIITIGQTGAGRAALDVAVEMDIPCETGIVEGLPGRERHSERRPDEAVVRERNVLNSHGTLIVSRGKLKGGPAFTKELAKKNGRPWLHIDLAEDSAFCAVSRITHWIFKYNIGILNIEGPLESENPKIYPDTLKLLKAIFFMDIGDLHSPHSIRQTGPIPGTVEEAVDTLTAELGLKERVIVSRMKERELPALNFSLGRYITGKYGLRAKGSELMNACRFLSKKADLQEDDASALIIHELWTRLKKTHKPRVVPPGNLIFL